MDIKKSFMSGSCSIYSSASFALSNIETQAQNICLEFKQHMDWTGKDGK